MIMLRVAKDKKFLAAADGRSRHGSAQIWEELSVEVTNSCQDWDDVAASTLSARALCETQRVSLWPIGPPAATRLDFCRYIGHEN